MATGGIKSAKSSERAFEVTNVVDSYTSHLLKKVFGDDDKSRKFSNLQSLETAIDEVLNNADSESQASPSISTREGILGPDVVTIDIAKNAGSVIIDADRLGATGLGNFSTLRANSCVYKGKWMYEVSLGSKGVMQIGWCTNQCKFSQEEGVGDTVTSYSYDGNRLRKWNKTTDKYGEMWLTGDVIGCCLDCDEGTLTFYRNGCSMGTAFNNVKLGPDLAYFPGFSVSQNENIRVNFGDVPFSFPVDGYNPLQPPPLVEIKQADILFDYLERLLPAIVDVEMAEVLESPSKSVKYSHEAYAAKTCHSLITAHIFHKLAPLLKKSYIVDQHLVKLLLKFYSGGEKSVGEKVIEIILVSMWAFMQEFEIKLCLGHLVLSLLSAYRFQKDNEQFDIQKTYLGLTVALLKHEKTRLYTLKHILFDKIKVPLFFNVKVPSDSVLEAIVPSPWWGFPTKKMDEEKKSESKEEAESRRLYYKSCDTLHDRVLAVEKIQVELLKILLVNDKEESVASSRFIFLHKFRRFLRNNSTHRTAAHLAQYVPQPVLLCFFHRLLIVFRQLWLEEGGGHREIPHVPVKKFCDESIDFFDVQRLGGLVSHLKKDNKDEITNALQNLADEEGSTSLPSTSRKVDDYEATLEKLGISDEYNGSSQLKYKCKNTSLLELLDGITLLYHTSAHKQLTKMSGLRDVIGEYITSLQDTDKKLGCLQPDHEQVQDNTFIT